MMLQLAVILVALSHVASFSHVGYSSLSRGHAQQRLVPLSATKPNPENFKMNSQIARLNAVAAKLRAEAAELEAEQRQIQMLNLADAFRSFDKNNDGVISVRELKDGLADALESNISEQQALKIMRVFDTSGDGSLQLEEFQGVEVFRRKLDQILQDEKDMAFVAKREATEAKLAAEKAEAIAELINNQPPTTSDRVLAGLPYMLPLLDVLPYGRYLIENNPAVQTNPVFQLFALAFTIYQTVPFSGLIAFFSLNVLTNNLRLNRLIRFSIQQAILIDIALVVPGLAGTIAEVLSKYAGTTIPPEVSTISSSATFFVFFSLFLYGVGCSWLGVEGDQIPFISDRVKRRVPTTKDFVNMFDADGNFKAPPDEAEMLAKRNKSIMKSLEPPEKKEKEEEDGETEADEDTDKAEKK
ncbi:hypothetical protein B484DRAFT_445960 [Ochromonadaceae sp. CCMP2298]|nr:hypothetical protein B484DRAFT_445960 [Ochromonadaceae sp. CCMP2298]